MISSVVKRGRAILGMLLVAASILAIACGQTGTTASPESPTPSQEATPAPASEITVTDIVDRTVTVEAPVERMILGEGRQLYIVAMLEPDDPFRRVDGWRDDLIKNDLDAFKRSKRSSPKPMRSRSSVTRPNGEFSVEQAIALEPDVVVLNLDAYQGAQEAGLIDHLAEAGIPTVVIDYRQYPLENTVPSTLLMGQLMGEEERAQEFTDYYRQQLNEVYSRVEKIEKPKPTAFLYRAAGFGDCCGTFGSANLGLLIERAGGTNLGTDLVPGWSGTINPEEVVSANPDLVIVTGANWVQVSQRAVLSVSGTPRHLRAHGNSLSKSSPAVDGTSSRRRRTNRFMPFGISSTTHPTTSWRSNSSPNGCIPKNSRISIPSGFSASFTIGFCPSTTVARSESP